MKKIRIAIILVMTIIVGLVLSACSSKQNKSDSVAPSSPNMKADYDYERDEAGASADYISDNGITSITEIATPSIGDQSMDKIITKVNLEVETQDFDELINIIKDEITRLDGYDERTEVSGKSYYSRSNSRYGYIIARIPKARLKEFIRVVKDNGNVVNESSSSENVTLQYFDTQSRKKSLEIEQERLWALLEKTEKLEDIVTLESRLSSIRYELQMYETELRTIDNKVEYSTVTISLREVERITPTQEKETVMTRIKNGFEDTIYNITEGLKDFFVWFIINLPYLLIWAVVITGLVLLSRKVFKNKRNKKRRITEPEVSVSDSESEK